VEQQQEITQEINDQKRVENTTESVIPTQAVGVSTQNTASELDQQAENVHNAQELPEKRGEKANEDADKTNVPPPNTPETSEDDDEPHYEPNVQLNRIVALWCGNITQIEVGAIVNAANKSLLGGGGVDGAIHNAAGSKLYDECCTLHGANTGETKITRGYNLPAQYVLHTVGPIGENPEKLASCYHTCLELCAQHNVRSVVFCGVSTGIFGYPLYEASRVALKTVRDWLEDGDNLTKLDKVIFCTYLNREEKCYEELMPQYFPPAPDPGFTEQWKAQIQKEAELSDIETQNEPDVKSESSSSTESIPDSDDDSTEDEDNNPSDAGSGGDITQ